MVRFISLASIVCILGMCDSFCYADVGDIEELPDGTCGEVTREQTAGQGEICEDPEPIPEQPPGVIFSKELIKVIHYPTWSHCTYRIKWQWTITVPCPDPASTFIYNLGPPTCQ